MTLDTLDCPHCGEKISLNEALAKQASEQLERQLQNKLQLEKQKITQELKKQSLIEINDLKKEIHEKTNQLQLQQQTELELRKKARILEEKERNLELEFLRKFDQEKTKFQDEISRRFNEENKLKMAEKEKQLSDMRTQIEELKRKADQGPVELQGEVFEREIENELKILFPLDHIGPVPKGVRGGDIIHGIRTSSGHDSGTILWELKRTKHWSDSWVQKLKDDAREINADLAILITHVMPKGIRHLGLYEGIWVCEATTFEATAKIMRHQLLQIHLAKITSQGKGEKMDFLYNYLTGNQFRQRIEAILEAFKVMQDELEKEKKSLQRSWAVRESQISKVLMSTSGLYGDVQGIVGVGLPKIQELEWENLQ